MSSSHMSGDEQLPQMEADEEDIEQKSGEGNIETTENRAKRGRYHRHTPQQTQAMEEFFRNCPHPDSHQRDELSNQLGMEPSQIKFWFQNKRTHMKTKHQRQENAHLKAENERLVIENQQYKEALSKARCPECGRMASIGDVSLDDRHLIVENAKLREEISRISSLAASYVGKPFAETSRSVANNRPMATDHFSFFKGSTSNGRESGEKKDYDVVEEKEAK